MLCEQLTPHAGSGSDLTAFLLGFSHPTMFALYHAESGCAIPELHGGFCWGGITRDGASTPQRRQPHEPSNTAGDCLARMALVTANHNPHACRLLAGSSSFPLACAYTAPHLNQASPLVTNTNSLHPTIKLPLESKKPNGKNRYSR